MWKSSVCWKEKNDLLTGKSALGIEEVIGHLLESVLRVFRNDILSYEYIVVVWADSGKGRRAVEGD